MRFKPMLRRSVVAVAALCLSGAALAQQNVTRLIVPFSAGGPIDISARVLAEGVKEHLGTVIIENKPGAGGNIGSDLVAKAKPDGKTIGVATLASHAVNPWLYSSMPYDADKDFAGVSLMVYVPNVLVMNSEHAEKLGIQSVADLIAYAKANPGKLNYGSGGNGSGGHLAGELFKKQAEVDIVHIPYNGGAPAQMALLSAEVDFTFDNLATAAPNIQNGKLKALAVTTDERSDVLPDIPTVKESGLDDFSVATWWGLVAPAGTPEAEIKKLNEAFVAAMNSDKAKERFAGLLITPTPSSPEAFDQLMQEERTRYKQIVEDAGARVD
ncbi:MULTISPECIES: Bug family tripartite tricarboxylate transporter substrate binding protein [Paenalcaligenes]|mgnify:FL=1|uniref:Tripartite tricarboxylate transporter substrate binding protein n=1 Tax=Paenalcaligenes hermetiae TaxID=1157987 RepID=A0ABP9M2P1_9BURK|nr:tripartite tricarboxylate transporter substrate binding protein [Paenalcaligenes sp.]